MQNLIVFDLGFVITRSRNKSYRENVRNTARLLLGFLEQHGLILNKTWQSAEDFSDSVRIMESDLTEEGRALFRSGAIDRWLVSLDRPRKTPRDTKLLQKEIKTLLTSQDA